MSEQVDPNDFIITRKRKKFKFAHFANYPNCFEMDEFRIVIDEKRPITVEIGAGTGLFSVELAKRNPGNIYVATDVKADRLQAGAKQALADGVTNVVFVRVHAESLPKIFQPDTVASIWLTFSDPFPKKRHIKHRLTSGAFLSMYTNMLKNDGQLYIKHDNKQFFEWSLEQLVAYNWYITELTFDLHESDLADDYKILTTYEQRWLNEGGVIGFVAAKRGD